MVVYFRIVPLCKTDIYLHSHTPICIPIGSIYTGLYMKYFWGNGMFQKFHTHPSIRKALFVIRKSNIYIGHIKNCLPIVS